MPGIRFHSEDYVTFLGRNDGLDFNGHVIYGATEHKASILSGLSSRTSNLASGARVLPRHLRPDYAQDRTNRAWVALDRPSLGFIATFPSFDAIPSKVCVTSRQGMTGHSRDAALSACCI